MPRTFGGRMLLERRGGSEVATDSIDASSYPTSPPASTHTHFQSIPEIGGSEGGFIGLVVGLGVIFIGSCVAVFFLLRNWRHGGRTVRGKSGELGVESTIAGPEFPRQRGTLFGFRSQNPRKSGWVRAPGEDEDEWDASDNLNSGLDRSEYVRQDVPLEQRSYGNKAGGDQQMRDLSTPYSHGGDEFNPTSEDLEAHGGAPPRPQSFRDPFDSSLGTNFPPQHNDATVAHHALYSSRTKDHQRQDSVDSAETAVTLPGGTKFKEDL